MSKTLPDNAIRMEARELEMRHKSGGRFRLVAMLYMWPSEPPKVGGQWPLITDVWRDGARLRPPILFQTQALPDEAYEARPKDVVVVIPVHPAEAARSVHHAREAVLA